MNELLRSWSDLGVKAKGLVIVAMALIVLLTMNAAYVLNAIRLRDAVLQVERSHRAKTELQALIGDLSQAEGGVASYVLTRDSTFLEPLDRARALRSGRLDRLNDIISDPLQLEDLRDRLIPASNARLRELERLRDEIRGHDQAPPASLVASRSEMQRLQTVVLRMIHRQDELLDDQRAAARVLEIWAIGTAVASALTGLAAGAVAVLMLSGGHLLRARPGGDARRVPAGPPSSVPARTKMAGSVLIVDDDARIRELLDRWLAPYGLELRQAVDAKSALSAIAERAPSVILCDVHMPGQDGLWLAERVRAIASTTAIVLATGDSTVSPFDSLRKGVVSYVLKPFRRDQVVSAVEEGIRWSATESRNNAPSASDGQRLLGDGII